MATKIKTNHTADQCWEWLDEHDGQTCDTHETCSWCSTMVNDSELRETNDGARICRICRVDGPYQRPTMRW